MSAGLKENLIALLEEQFFTGEDKVTFDYIFAEKIKRSGYHLQRSFTVKLSNGKKGFVDYMVTSPEGPQCAIEVDKKSPRARSLMKLKALPEGISGFVLLRDGKHPLRGIAEGVDVVRATRFK